jgi:predicted flavoprotein YhiN
MCCNGHVISKGKQPAKISAKNLFSSIYKQQFQLQAIPLRPALVHFKLSVTLSHHTHTDLESHKIKTALKDGAVTRQTFLATHRSTGYSPLSSYRQAFFALPNKLFI